MRILIPPVLLSLLLVAPVARSEEVLRVMSFNIRYNNPGDGIHAWPNRAQNVAILIGERYSADLAGLQEALLGQIEDLVRQLPDFDWVGVGRDDGWRKGEFSPIFYRRDRFELIQHNTFWLSETPEVPGSKSWDAAITRIVTWAKLLDRRTGRAFYLFNTHFDHRGRSAREHSARLLRQRVAELAGDEPAIVTGDLNFPEASKGYQLLVSDSAGPGRLIDSRYASAAGHRGPTASTNNWTRLRSAESRIDYILISGAVRTLSHRILADQFGGRYPSDHLPVLAEPVLSR